ncbi:hypothetical protein K501DRAFT_332163 [Backusella circina FSU 941]|nr:hypothetical protein K501DRAFT_332163 [Backusella circina FSU 941]
MNVNTDLLNELIGVAGDTQSVISYINSSETDICLVAIDFAGLSTNIGDLQSFFNEVLLGIQSFIGECEEPETRELSSSFPEGLPGAGDDDTFFTKKPHESIVIVQERLKDAMAFDIEFAEYFKERHFAPVWESLINEFTQVANIHSQMASRITEEIEKPLRQSPSPNDYQQLQQLEHNINSIDSHKNSLLSVKGSIFKKSSSGSKSSSWQQEGLEYLQLHQKLDEARLKRLKTTTEAFEQIQSDQLMKRVEMASITMSASEVFDIQYDINDFCHERGKELSSGKLNQDVPVRSTSEDNYQPHQHINTTRPRAATMDSSDTRRSGGSRASRIKSVFMKKKKHDKLDYQYTPENSIHQEIHHEPEESTSQQLTPVGNNSLNDSTTIPVASPLMKSASMTNSPLVDNEGFSIPDSNRHRFPGASDVSSQNTSEDVDSDYQSFQQSQKLHINIADQIVKENDKDTSESFNRMASILRERTPTISRKARGRRDTTSRAFTDSTLFNSTFMNPVGDQRSRSNSVLSSSSGGGDSNLSNPFLISTGGNAEASSPLSGHSPITYSPSDPSWQLHSIQEVVNPIADIAINEVVSMDDNDVVSVSGQIHLNYTGSTARSPASIRIQPPTQGTVEDWYIVQEQLISVSPENKDIYVLNSAILESNQGQYIPLIHYRIRLNHGRQHLPIQINPAWKCTTDTSYLIVKYNWNDDAIREIKGTISVTDQYAIGVQSTPQGYWETDGKKLTWSLHDIMENRPERLLAKFSMSKQSEPKPVNLQYNYDAASSLTGLAIESASQMEIKNQVTMVFPVDNLEISIQDIDKSLVDRSSIYSYKCYALLHRAVRCQAST